MTKILIHKSGANRIKQYHMIYEEEPYQKSLGSLVLLNDFLRGRDVDYLASDWTIRVKYNIEFLKLQLKQKGQLNCSYCRKQNLFINEDITKRPKYHFLATVDHVIPISKGGSIDDYENMTCACWHCNHSKKDHIGFKISENKYSWYTR
jgi:5-methylcytosine-specific restriction endonuclease McrA